MLMSIIVPMYNSSKTLHRCVDSIINQDFNDFEVILVDDGSTDDTAAVAKDLVKSDFRIKYFFKENGGASSARNLGISVAKGDYILFVDSDDMLASNCFSKMASIVYNYDVDFVKFNYYLSTSKNFTESIGRNFFDEDILVDTSSLKLDVIKKIISGKFSTFSCLLLIDRNFLSTLSGFNEDICYMEDKLFYIDAFSNSNKFFISNEVIYHYFYKSFDNLNNDFIIKYLDNIKLVYDNAIHILSKNFDGLVSYFSCIILEQINQYIFLFYCNNKNSDIKGLWSKYAEDIFPKVTKFSNISFFCSYCLDAVKNANYNFLKFLYFIKKLVKMK